MFNRDQASQLIKAAVLGAFTGLVFAVVFIAAPGAVTIFVVGALALPWDLSWMPGIASIMTFGAVTGALAAIFLYFKDRRVPYVEELQDFEEDPRDNGHI